MIMFIVFRPELGREGPSLGKFWISGCSSLSHYQRCCCCHHHYHQNGSGKLVIAGGTVLSAMVLAGQMCSIKTLPQFLRKGDKNSQ